MGEDDKEPGLPGDVPAAASWAFFKVNDAKISGSSEKKRTPSIDATWAELAFTRYSDCGPGTCIAGHFTRSSPLPINLTSLVGFVKPKTEILVFVSKEKGVEGFNELQQRRQS
jgi:hypothetical protein